MTRAGRCRESSVTSRWTRKDLPPAIHVTTANVTDRAGALVMFDENRSGLNEVQKVLVDGGYTGKPFATAVQSLLGASVEVVKRNKLHTFVVLPKRWVVERSFAWLEKCRRLWKNCERKLNTSLQMVVLAFMVLILKRLRTGSNMQYTIFHDCGRQLDILVWTRHTSYAKKLFRLATSTTVALVASPKNVIEIHLASNRYATAIRSHKVS